MRPGGAPEAIPALDLFFAKPECQRRGSPTERGRGRRPPTARGRAMATTRRVDYHAAQVNAAQKEYDTNVYPG